MKTILDLSNVKAYQYFMEPENYCNVSFPIVNHQYSVRWGK